MAYEKRQLPKKSDNLSDWYNAVVLLAELADYGPAKGTMIFRPAGYRIWELIQEAMDKEIKKSGVENAYFPLFIPESLMRKEKEHVEGFAPQLAVVTIGGGEELKEKLIVRPTSETIMYQAYAKWIQSWRDLPVLINQWNNVVRWEKRTYLFLRTTEFLWQEGHCAHATHQESQERVQWAIDMYAQIYRDFLALPGIIYEILMPEGKALQGCPSHDLGQNFSKAQGIKFQDKQGQSQFVWQNSWGFTTRSIGALLMAHGDDAGLVLPPRVAPVQVVIIPVTSGEEELAAARKLADNLGDVRVKVDTREGESLGFKINKWELKGVPLRIEVGKREIESGKFRMVRRDTGEVVDGEVGGILDQIQNDMLARQEKFLRESTYEAADYEQFKKIMESQRGFIKAFWCESKECESRIKEETKASTRCLPLDAKEEKGKCVYCGKAASHKWLFALAY